MVTVTETKTNRCDGMRCVQLHGIDDDTGREFDNDTYYITHDHRILFDDGMECKCETDCLINAIRNAIGL